MSASHPLLRLVQAVDGLHQAVVIRHPPERDEFARRDGGGNLRHIGEPQNIQQSGALPVRSGRVVENHRADAAIQGSRAECGDGHVFPCVNRKRRERQPLAFHQKVHRPEDVPGLHRLESRSDQGGGALDGGGLVVVHRIVDRPGLERQDNVRAKHGKQRIVINRIDDVLPALDVNQTWMGGILIARQVEVPRDPHVCLRTELHVERAGVPGGPLLRFALPGVERDLLTRKSAEALILQFGDERGAPRFPLLQCFRDSRPRARDEDPVDVPVDGAGRVAVEHLQDFRGFALDIPFFEWSAIFLQPTVDPFVGLFAERQEVRVRRVVVVLDDPVARAVELVNRAQPPVNLAVAGGRKRRVAPRADDFQRPRGDQGPHHRQVSQEGVVEVDAVAILVNGIESGVVLDRPGGANAGGDLQAFIHGRRVPGDGAAAGNARDGDPAAIDLRPGFQVIHGSDGVPGLGPGRSVPLGKPVPHFEVVRPVVNSGDLPELDRVDQQSDIAVSGKPDSMMLIVDLRTPRARGVPAKVEHRWERPRRDLGQIEVTRDIQPGHALEDNLLDTVRPTVQLAGNAGLERRLRRHWIQAQHVQDLLPQARADAFALVEGLDVAGKTSSDFSGPTNQILLEQVEPLRRTVGAGLRQERCRGQANRRERTSNGHDWRRQGQAALRPWPCTNCVSRLPINRVTGNAVHAPRAASA